MTNWPKKEGEGGENGSALTLTFSLFLSISRLLAPWTRVILALVRTMYTFNNHQLSNFGFSVQEPSSLIATSILVGIMYYDAP